MHQIELIFKTAGRGFIDITKEINEFIKKADVNVGVCHVFIKHTSASLLISENADDDVKKDLEAFMQKVAPDNPEIYQHTTEGSDDMPAHIRSVLTASSVVVPVTNSCLNLGTWQGLFLWEHRHQTHKRKIIVSCY